MIEVTHTGSPYFERAFLVVRGEGAPSSEEGLHRLAEKVVRQAETYAGLRQQRRRRRLQRAVFGLLSAGGGAALLWIIQQLIG
jgi:hypothetical protein